MIFYLVIVLLVLAGIIVLFGSHYFLYFTISHFYHLNGQMENYLIAALIVLAVSFIVASIFAHVRENNFTRLFYFASGFWLGLMVNLILASLVAWVFYFLVSRSPLDYIILSYLYLAAFVYSLYGIWNAFHPELKHIEVPIPNLPEQWKGKKIIQISDLHIGHIFKNYFMKWVVEKINTVQPEMVVITGDLFDGMDGELINPLKSLDDIKAKRGVFFITGNHETILGNEFVNKELGKTKVRLMKDEVIDLDGLKLIGINYPDHGETRGALEILEKLKDQYFEKPNIFLYHSPVNIKKVKKMGINLQLSGHTHNAQIFPLNWIAKIIFKGYNYGLYQEENYSLYVTNGTGSWGPTMRTGNRPEIVVITLK
jgi:predicted MPP superfamily phosphohydrolase